jgi:PAS domain S-box-containing protein
MDRYMFDLRKPGSGKRIAALVLFCALMLLAAGTFLNVWFGRSARQILRDRFNDQQLVVARSVRRWIENRMDTLQKELLLASEALAKTDGSREAVARVLHPCFDRVMEMGVRKIELLERDREEVLVCYPSPLRIVAEPRKATGIDAPATPADTVTVSEPVVDGAEIYLTLCATPDHPLFEALSFELNAAWFLNPFLKSIRSGSTGYAWIIDARGRFLFHPQASFIGRSAFEARQDRDPDISYHQIDTIQREKMLKGVEGTGVYTSTWHRGITGEIEKLIAYTPVTVSDAPERNWSVAVVAPLLEIEEGLRKIHLWQALLQGLVVLVILTAGGVVLWFEVRWTHRLEKMVGERTRALARSEEKYRSLVESAEDFIFTVDRSGALVSVNSFTAAFFGCRPEEVTGRGIDCFFSREAARHQKEIIRTVYDRGKSIRHEFELATESPEEIWLSANFMPMKDEAGNMSAVLCIARDITDHKKLERFLVTTEKLASLGTLAAGVAHEINNPLGVMLGFCDLLVRKKTPGSREYEDLKVIERQGMHCKQIVENLLTFARVDRQKSSDADLNECLKEIIKVVRHSLEMNAIDLELNFAENLPRAVGDDRQLQQVFMNLINNAAAAMPRGGPLSIRTVPKTTSERVCVLIEDRGSGIAPEHLDHIFEPFYTTKPEGEGTGLGLFVSYGIIHQFGGSITCESRTQPVPGASRGTTFTVTLPIYRET